MKKKCTGAHCKCMNLDGKCPNMHYADCMEHNPGAFGIMEGKITIEITQNTEGLFEYIFTRSFNFGSLTGRNRTCAGAASTLREAVEEVLKCTIV